MKLEFVPEHRKYRYFFHLFSREYIYRTHRQGVKTILESIELTYTCRWEYVRTQREAFGQGRHELTETEIQEIGQRYPGFLEE